MSKTSNNAELLQVCIQDLHSGCVAAASRLPEIIAPVANQALREAMENAHGDYAARAQRLEQTGYDLSGPENLWMKGILDDAVRDTQSTASGPILDVALVGAMRKAFQAERVSIETAQVLAERLEHEKTLGPLAANHRETSEADRKLQSLLAQLAA
ncbi:DUF892 family protein [Stakelama saccharophila]|uniref:DUF892 family protein n=1 Tax=Stakelama saccharophila TaxID=3075605 RepID=A0ABZ0B5P5_9SPHN|nr:DUF892 family protein [Stakelama sp. W311]WNO52694.1 DUF892 family protein [Stakelama sp. W311]